MLVYALNRVESSRICKRALSLLCFSDVSMVLLNSCNTHTHTRTILSSNPCKVLTCNHFFYQRMHKRHKSFKQWLYVCVYITYISLCVPVCVGYLFEILKGELVHGVDLRKTGDDEIHDGATRGHGPIFLPGGVYHQLCGFGFLQTGFNSL